MDKNKLFRYGEYMQIFDIDEAGERSFVGVERLVRCRHCIHFDAETSTCDRHGSNVVAKGYCSYGVHLIPDGVVQIDRPSMADEYEDTMNGKAVKECFRIIRNALADNMPEKGWVVVTAKEPSGRLLVGHLEGENPIKDRFDLFVEADVEPHTEEVHILDNLLG